MNAQPVSMHDEVFAWACGTCGRMQGIEYLKKLHQDYMERDPNYTEPEYTAQQAAEDCCLCRTEGCHVPIDRRIQGTYCDACHWYHRWGYMWRTVGYVVRLGITNELIWLDYGHYMNALHDYMDGIEYRGCHCGHDSDDLPA